ncbi:LysR family transcriptional regulator [Paenibacillus filicis]|uniref:LysR family transcriptional regulator n=1 Tax=Paenibacillus filicis TaxID=669464 RepID=A0ABU9DIR8_9BACL
MEVRKLQHFVEVAAAGSFTKASERLHVAQPAISKSIQKLEEDLEVTLFDRSEKSAILTPEGRVLLRHAHAILERVEEARHEMRELRGLQSGEVQIGLPSMFSSAYFPPIMKAFREDYPSLRINVVEEGTVQIRSLLEQKKVDLGIIAYDPEEQELDVDPLLTDELVVCFPADHPLAGRNRVTLQQVLAEPLVLFKEGYFQRKLLEEASAASGLPQKIIFTTNQLSLIRSLVLEGVGVTLFLSMLTAGDPQLRAVPLDPPVYVHLGIGRRRHTYLSIASRTFLDFLKRHFAGSASPAPEASGRPSTT